VAEPSAPCTIEPPGRLLIDEVVRRLPDPRLELVAAFSLGVGTGLWLVGSPVGQALRPPA
jgi:hypothetical protein